MIVLPGILFWLLILVIFYLFISFIIRNKGMESIKYIGIRLLGIILYVVYAIYWIYSHKLYITII